MRAIEFRGKSLQTGEWVYGGCFQDGEKYFIVRTTEWYGEKVTRLVEVDYQTIGKYTTKKDALQEPVYAGDILVRKNSINLARLYLVNYDTHLVYDDEAQDYKDTIGFYLTAFEKDKKIHSSLGLGKTEVWAKKIGNIYDDKRLIKV